jgi:hypothetical protein
MSTGGGTLADTRLQGSGGACRVASTGRRGALAVGEEVVVSSPERRGAPQEREYREKEKRDGRCEGGAEGGAAEEGPQDLRRR